MDLERSSLWGQSIKIIKANLIRRLEEILVISIRTNCLVD